MDLNLPFVTRLYRHSLLPALMLVIALGIVMSGWADEQQSKQQDDDKTKTTQTQQMPALFTEVTVTATGSEREVFDLATPVTVLRAEEIRRKAVDNVADLLRDQPGVDVNGVGPNQVRPVIRGQRGLRVLYLADGLRLNNARRQTDFGEITGLVDLDSLSAVEVVRGPASVLYGSDAVGGVINAISRHARSSESKPLSGFTELRYSGAGDLTRGSAGIDSSFGRFSLQLGASLRTADDYDAPAGTFGGIRLSENTVVRDSAVDDASAWGSLTFIPNQRDTFRLRVNHYRADDTGFGYVPAAAYGAEETALIRILYPNQQFERYTLSYFGSPLERLWADSANVQIYAQSNERELVNDIDIDIGPVAPGFPRSSVASDTRNFTDLDTWGLRTDAVKAVSGRHIVTYGLEIYRDESHNTDFSRTTTTIRLPFPPFERITVRDDAIANAPNATNTSSGLFVQDETSLASRLRLTAGLRYHNVETRAESTPGWTIDGLDFKDDNVVGALTATYQITSELNALASYGTAFRAPNIIERLFNGPTPEGAGFQILNPQLTSETSGNWDLGFKFRRSDAFVELVAFRNDIEDGIIQSFLSPAEVAALPAELRTQITASGARFVVKQENTDHLRYQGVELALGYRTRSGVTLGGNYTFIDSDRVGSFILPPGDSYSDKTFVYARYQPANRRYWAEYHVRHNGSTEARLDPDEPLPPVGRILPSFTVHGLGAGARLYERAGLSHDLTLWVENLTDELYAEFSNATFFRPEPGRTAKVSYRLGF